METPSAQVHDTSTQPGLDGSDGPTLCLFDLLSLPVEIRQLIYSFALVAPNPIPLQARYEILLHRAETSAASGSISRAVTSNDGGSSILNDPATQSGGESVTRSVSTVDLIVCCPRSADGPLHNSQTDEYKGSISIQPSCVSPNLYTKKLARFSTARTHSLFSSATLLNRCGYSRPRGTLFGI